MRPTVILGFIVITASIVFLAFSRDEQQQLSAVADRASASTIYSELPSSSSSVPSSSARTSPSAAAAAAAALDETRESPRKLIIAADVDRDYRQQRLRLLQKRLLAVEEQMLRSPRDPQDRQLVTAYREVHQRLRRHGYHRDLFSSTKKNNHNSTGSYSYSLRPHQMSYADFWASSAQLPVAACSPSTSTPTTKIRVSEFCTPNPGRFFESSRVFPISYGIPREQFFPIPQSVEKLRSVKSQNCSRSLPLTRVLRLRQSILRGENETLKATVSRLVNSRSFDTQAEYMADFQRSFYCLVHKKGGWDTLRLYEIIAAGCMPYFVDLEYVPAQTLTHLPKRLLLEARQLAGVDFSCATLEVEIDSRLFPLQRYFDLLRALRRHALQFLTTEALARYVLTRVAGIPEERLPAAGADNDGGWKKRQPQNETTGDLAPSASPTSSSLTPPRILYLQKRLRGANRRARGSYNAWLLLHGLRTLFAEDPGLVVDPNPMLKFLYKNYLPSYQVRNRQTGRTEQQELYGQGWNWAFLLEDSPSINRTASSIRDGIRNKKFDLIIYADPFSFGLGTQKDKGGRNSRKKKKNDGADSRMIPPLKMMKEILAAGYSREQVIILNAADVPYPDALSSNFDWSDVYKSNGATILQREVSDCDYFVPRLFDEEPSAAEMMKRCVFYATRNCFDDSGLLKVTNK